MPENYEGSLCTKILGKRWFRLAKSQYCEQGLETIRYRGPKTWKLVPDDIKEAKSVAEFKAKIKNWKPTDCDCRLCKTYVKGVGYGIFKDGAFVWYSLHSLLWFGLFFHNMSLSFVSICYPITDSATEQQEYKYRNKSTPDFTWIFLKERKKQSHRISNQIQDSYL